MALAYPQPSPRPQRRAANQNRPKGKLYTYRPRPSPMERYHLPRPKGPLQSAPFTPPPYKMHPLTQIGRMAGRFFPILGFGLMGWEVYRWWSAQAGSAVPAGWTECYNLGGPYQKMKRTYGPAGQCHIVGPPCSYGIGAGVSFQVPDGDYTPGQDITIEAYTGSLCRVEHIYTGPSQSSGNRMIYNRKWSRVVGNHPQEDVGPQPGKPAPPVQPENIPAWLPTYDPMSIPIGRPMPTPAPLPYRALPRHNRPRPEPRPLAPPAPGDLPALEIEPGKAPRKATHKRQQPSTNEREGKHNPKGNLMTKLGYKAMHNTLNGYTETDDIVRAVYHALPWRERRWKGDDGIWRDRHWRTADRLNYIYRNFDSVSKVKALKNLVVNQAIDRIGGAMGHYGRRAIRENPYYRGLVGLQSGQRFTKATWAIAYELMKEGAAMQHQPRDYYRWQMVDDQGRVVHWDQLEPSETFVETPYGARPSYYYDLSQLPPGFKWERNLVKGRKQMIPWLQSTYHKRIVNPRKGTVDWWRANNGKRIATEERRMYVHPA